MPGVVRYQVEVGDEARDIGSLAYTDSTMQEITVNHGSTGIQLDFGGVSTADLFYLTSDQNISVYFAVSGTEIPVVANKPLILSGTSLMAIYVTNQSGSDAHLQWRIYGDSGASTTPATSDLSTALANTSNPLLGDGMIGYKAGGTGAVGRTVHSRLADLQVSVKDYGAKGDGVTDDSASVQAAVDSLVGAGGTVYFPPGRYIVRDIEVMSYYPINLIGDMGISDTYLGKNYITAGANADYIFKYAVPSGAAYRSLAGGGKISGLAFYDPSYTRDTPDAAGTLTLAYAALYLVDFGASKVEYCHFRGLNGSAIKGDSVIKSDFDNLHIEFCGSTGHPAIDFDGATMIQAVNITNSKMEVCFDEPYIVLPAYPNGGTIKISNCNFESNYPTTSATGQTFIDDTGGAGGAIITNNSFSRTLASTVILGSYDTKFSNNFIHGESLSGNADPRISVLPAAQRSSIDHNTVWSYNDTGKQAYFNSTGLTIDHNVFYYGGSIVSTGYNTLIGNRIINNKTADAYTLTLATGDVAIGNSISGTMESAGGIFVAGTAPILIGNTVLNAAAIGIRNESGSSIGVGNYVYGSGAQDFSTTTATDKWANNTFATGDKPSQRLTDSVGIGKSPSTNLDITGTTGLAVNRTATGWTAYFKNSTGSGAQSGALIDAGSSISDYGIYIRNAAGTVDLFYVRGNGYVGMPGILVFANNAAALAGGLSVGMLYRTNSDPDTLCIVH